MRFEHIAGRYNAFLKAKCGVSQVLVGFFQVLFGHGQFLGSFVHLESRLVDLQLYLFFGVIQLVLGDACFRFGCFYFIDAFAPVPDGYRHHDTHIPHPLELFLETVEDGRVGCHIAAH